MVVAGAGISAALLSDNDFHLDVLQRDLIVDRIQQFQRALVRHVIAPQFDPHRLALKLGMSGEHLAIENEGNVSVEFFLELMEPLIRAVPRPRFVHRQDDLARLAVHSEKIDDGRVRDAGRNRLLLLILIMIMIVLLILPHWAE